MLWANRILSGEKGRNQVYERNLNAPKERLKKLIPALWKLEEKQRLDFQVRSWLYQDS